MNKRPAFIVIAALAAVMAFQAPAFSGGENKLRARFEREYESWLDNGKMHLERGETGNALLCLFKAERLNSTAEVRELIKKAKAAVGSKSGGTAPLKPIPVSEEREVTPRKNAAYKGPEDRPGSGVKRAQFFRRNYGFFVFPEYTMGLREGDFFDMPVAEGAAAPADGTARLAGAERKEVLEAMKNEEKAAAAKKEETAATAAAVETTEDGDDANLPETITEYIEDIPESFFHEEGQVILRNGKRHGKMVALTFDDGPHPSYTQRILKILKENDVKATFFVLGSRVAEYPKIAQQIVKEGHTIGNHSYTHPFFKKSKPEKIDRELEKTNDIIKRTTGVKRVKYYRPPYGSMSKYFIEKASDDGFYIIMWSVDSKDYQGRSADKTLDKVLKHVRGGDVMLFHDIHAATVDVIDELVPILKKAKFRFVSLDEIYGMEADEPEKGTAEVRLAAGANGTGEVALGASAHTGEAAIARGTTAEASLSAKGAGGTGEKNGGENGHDTKFKPKQIGSTKQ